MISFMRTGSFHYSCFNGVYIPAGDTDSEEFQKRIEKDNVIGSRWVSALIGCQGNPLQRGDV